MQAQLLEEYCAKLMDIDLVRFQKETKAYQDALVLLENATSQQHLHLQLQAIYKTMGFSSPYGSHAVIDSFMKDKSARLTFS